MSPLYGLICIFNTNYPLSSTGVEVKCIALSTAAMENLTYLRGDVDIVVKNIAFAVKHT